MDRKRVQVHKNINKHVGIPVFNSATFNQYIGLMMLIVAGVAFGALYVKISGVGKPEHTGTGYFMQDIFSSEAASRGFMSLAASSFFPVSLLVCIAFLLGLCAIGFPFELIVPVIHGAWIGVSLAAIDVRYGVKGLGICLLFIMPQALISSLAIMVASREGVRFSRSISKTVFRGIQQSFNAVFRIYCIKYVVCFMLAAIASMIEAFSIILFSKIFFT